MITGFKTPSCRGLHLLAWLVSSALSMQAQTLQRKAPAPSPPPPQVVAPPLAAKPPAAVAQLNSGAINTAVRTEPTAVTFGSVFSGDSQRATVKVVAPRDGKVTITLVPNSPFSIAEVKVFGIPKSPSILPNPTQAPKQASGSQVMATGHGAAPAVASSFSLSLLATCSSPPFSVPVWEGNQVVISLVFAPKLDLLSGPAVGDHKATLLIDGEMWKSAARVSGRFEGLKIGFIAVMATPDVVVYPDKVGNLLEAALTLTNPDKQPATAQISAQQLPPGFKLAALSAMVPAGQTRKVPLLFPVSSAMKEGAQQQAALTVTCAGLTKTVPFTFSVYPSSKQFHSTGSDGLEWEFWMTISPSGHTAYAYAVKNPNVMVGRRFMFEIQWRGTRLNTMGNDVGNYFPGKQGNLSTYGWSIQNNTVRDHYVEMLQEPPNVTLTYKNE